MKIFAVSSGTYSDYGINAMFSTRELAEKYIADHTDKETGKTDAWDSYIVEEWELDASYDVPVWGTQYLVDLDLKTGAVCKHPATMEPCRVVLRNPKERGKWFTWPEYTRGTSYISKEHAHKLAVEGRQAYLRDNTIQGSVE